MTEFHKVMCDKCSKIEELKLEKEPYVGNPQWTWKRQTFTRVDCKDLCRDCARKYQQLKENYFK